MSRSRKGRRRRILRKREVIKIKKLTNNFTTKCKDVVKVLCTSIFKLPSSALADEFKDNKSAKFIKNAIFKVKLPNIKKAIVYRQNTVKRTFYKTVLFTKQTYSWKFPRTETV